MCVCSFMKLSKCVCGMWCVVCVCVCVCVCEVALRWWDSRLIFLVLLQLMNCPDILNGHR